ncbi:MULTISPECIES: hypothetical protein [unclassified Marinobacterium]|jgi:hypothetical protein|uniref:hypothetical protein n=1 Tax=unclassified Marinobacterium TaxID=2644139 RepID=UPI001567D4D7|nr:MULTISPECIES: hypothetical protein [unclassified Marinobacterium]NRP51694.1 hypothetical protein [Marinobacterium sp. xm-v-242]NRP76275.1 hypothetical protein [Marinobacterium sp. xm-m-383]
MTLPTLNITQRLTSPSLALATLLTLITEFGIADLSYAAGILIWSYLGFRFGHLKPKQKRQIGTLLVIGGVLIALAAVINPYSIDLLTLLKANQLIIALLVAVSFLRVITHIRSDEQTSTGNVSILKTLLGTHAIASIINISASQIVADRIQRSGELNAAQGVVIARAFGLCAFWSPFFAAMGVTLISAPDAQLFTLVIWGLPSTAIALLFTYLQIAKKSEYSPFIGYPLSINSLALPVGLATTVLLTHYWYPNTSVILQVSLLSILAALLIAPMIGKSQAFKSHVFEGLNGSSGEVSLFVAASVLATGFSAVINATGADLTPDTFGFSEATITLTFLVGLSMIGVHPVTSNLIAGALLLPVATDHNLLGITLLFSWSMGVTLSPLAGNQILLQARYGVRARDLLKANLPFALVMMPVCFGVLYLYQEFGG